MTPQAVSPVLTSSYSRHPAICILAHFLRCPRIPLNSVMPRRLLISSQHTTAFLLQSLAPAQSIFELHETFPFLLPDPATIQSVIKSSRFFLCYVCARCCAQSLQSCPALCDSMDCTHQAPLSTGFFRQEYQSGLPCPPLGDFPSQGWNPHLLHHR